MKNVCLLRLSSYVRRNDAVSFPRAVSYFLPFENGKGEDGIMVPKAMDVVVVELEKCCSVEEAQLHLFSSVLNYPRHLLVGLLWVARLASRRNCNAHSATIPSPKLCMFPPI